MPQVIPSFSVLILFNKPLTTQKAMLESDSGVLEEVRAVQASLEKLGYRYRTVGINSLHELYTCLTYANEPVVFNLVEYLPQDPQDASKVPSVCQAFGKSCTGSDSLALMLSLDKWRTKGLLRQASINVPQGVVVKPGQNPHLELLFSGPYIVKPIAADASEGIDDTSVVQSADEKLSAVISRIHNEFKQAALIEQYVGQREINASLLQVQDQTRVLPLAEIDLSALGERPRIVAYAAKWLVDSFEYSHTPRLLPAPVSDELAEEIRQVALTAWAAVGCQDYARVDMRLGQDNQVWVLEVNPNPDISPDAGFTASLLSSGMGYDEFIAALVKNAWQRYRNHSAVQGAELNPKGESIIRQASTQDRFAVESMLERSGYFREDELPVALEVFDDSQRYGSDYHSYVIAMDDKVLGWISFGPTPGTLGNFNVYWLVVEPTLRSSGFGTKLLAFAEEQIRLAGGRLVVIETSGSPLYYPTRQFYLKRGYTQAAVITDFYAPGDDEVIYTKVIA
ncbi:MAG: GNAT family N-acetyltransferase [Anaerolineae bacterium]